MDVNFLILGAFGVAILYVLVRVSRAGSAARTREDRFSGEGRDLDGPGTRFDVRGPGPGGGD